MKDQNNIARSIYCVEKDNTLIILHSFLKKTQKTPIDELFAQHFPTFILKPLRNLRIANHNKSLHIKSQSLHQR